MGRRTITAAMERKIIMAQMREGYIGTYSDGGVGLLCACGCQYSIYRHTPVIHEHMTPLCMGGADDETNIRLVRKECAHRKTYGTKATTAGSDIANNAKCDRITGKTGKRKSRPMKKREHYTWPKRPFPKAENRR